MKEDNKIRQIIIILFLNFSPELFNSSVYLIFPRQVFLIDILDTVFY